MRRLLIVLGLIIVLCYGISNAGFENGIGWPTGTTVDGTSISFPGPVVIGTTYQGSTRAGIDAAMTAGAKSIELSGDIVLAAHWDLSGFTGRFSTNGHTISGAFTFTAPADFSGSDNCFGSTLTVVGLKEARPDWFYSGSGLHSAAIQAAVVAVSATGGTVLYGPGTYTLLEVNTAYNNITHQGSPGTKLKKAAGEWVMFRVQSADINSYITGLKFFDIEFEGLSVDSGFVEHANMLELRGVDGVTIERCKFTEFESDAITLAYPAGSVRHNKNVYINNCVFDGVNNDNRNAISVMDGDGIRITNSLFTRCSRTDMPGAIDVEPNSGEVDYVNQVIRDIQISECRFINNKGSNGSISVYLPAVAYVTWPTGFTFKDNYFYSSDGLDTGIHWQSKTEPTSTTSGYAVSIDRNIIVNTNRAFRLYGVKDADIINNKIIGTYASPLVGYLDAADQNVYNVNFVRNRFERVGTDATTGGNGILVFSAARLLFESNEFVDCGKSNGTLGNAINFYSGTSSFVRLIQNQFTSPGSKTTHAIKKEAAHTFTPANNEFYGNYMGVAGNLFVATNTDVMAAFTPVVSGGSSAGTGTYTYQKGTASKIGNVCQFIFSVAWSAHTGSGQILVSLPNTPSAYLNFSNVAVSGSGMVYTAGNTLTANIGSTGKVEISQLTPSGATTSVDLAATGTLYLSGFYIAN